MVQVQQDFFQQNVYPEGILFHSTVMLIISDRPSAALAYRRHDVTDRSAASTTAVVSPLQTDRYTKCCMCATVICFFLSLVYTPCSLSIEFRGGLLYIAARMQYYGGSSAGRWHTLMNKKGACIQDEGQSIMSHNETVNLLIVFSRHPLRRFFTWNLQKCREHKAHTPIWLV